MDISIQEIAKEVKPVMQKYGVKSAGLFGSYARGDARADSDVDILVSLGSKPLSLWDFVAFKNELSDILKKTVDLISDKAIIPYFKDYIYKDLKPLYE